MFEDYLKKQLSSKKIYEQIGVSKATFYRHLKDPKQITIGELREMMRVGKLDEEVVLDWIRGKK